MENKRYTAEEVLNLQSAAYQKGYNEGYELRKSEQPGAVWVKAPEFKFVEGAEYFYKYEYLEKHFKGVAKYDDGMLWSSITTVLPVGYAELYILDESAAGREQANRCPVYVPCAENDPDCCGAYTSNDGRSLCYVKEVMVPLSAFKQQKEK